MIGPGQARLTAVVAGVGRPDGVASGAGAIWITDSADDMLLRVDPACQVIDRIPASAIYESASRSPMARSGWRTSSLDGNVSDVNPASGTQVAVIPAGIGPDAIASGYGSVWVANVTSDTVSRIDAATGDVVSTIPLRESPVGIAARRIARSWVTSQDTGELLRVDPGDDRLSRAIAIGQSPGRPRRRSGQLSGSRTPAARYLSLPPLTNRQGADHHGQRRSGLRRAWHCRRGGLGRQHRQRNRVQDRSADRRDAGHPGWETSRRISPLPGTTSGRRCSRHSRAIAAARSPSSISCPQTRDPSRRPTWRRYTPGHGRC